MKDWLKKLLTLAFVLSWVFEYPFWFYQKIGFDGFKIKTAEAAQILYKKGNFTAQTSTGNQQITGVGFQPKALIFYYTTQTATGNSSASSGHGMGFTTGSSNSYAVATYSVAAGTSDTARVSSESKAIIILSGVSTIGGAASLVSLDSNGFTLNWQTAAAAAYIIHYIALGGSGLTALASTFTLNTTSGDQSVSVGFQPDFLLFLSIDSNSASETIDTNALFSVGFASSASNQAGLGLYSRDAQGTSDTCSVQRTDNSVVLAGPAGTACNTIDALASLKSFDTSGFTLTKNDLPSSDVKVHYLALKGGRYKVGYFNSRTSTGSQSISDVGFNPDGLILTTFGLAANTAAQANYYFGFGSTDGTTHGYIARADADSDNNPDPDVTTQTAQFFGAYTGNGTVGLAASFTSFDTSGFTINWTTAQSTARQILYWAISGISTFTLADYRFFQNLDSLDVGSPLANQNTPATLSAALLPFRLRLLIYIGDKNLPLNGQDFKLQYVGKGSGTCSSPSGGDPSTWTDVNGSTYIAYNDNPTPADGALLTANTNDPYNSYSSVNQSYEEANNFTNNQSAINAGYNGKWDFALKDNNAPSNTTYCLRVVKADGTLLDSYSYYPEITTANHNPVVSGVSLNNQTNISLIENSTTSVNVTATVYDNNGCTTISSVSAKIYRSGVSGGKDCTLNENNCYSATCVQDSGSCSGSSDKDATYTCTFNLQFFADPTDEGTPYASQYWKAYVEAVDTSDLHGSGYNLDGAPEVSSLLALDVTDTIDYGNLEPGAKNDPLDKVTTVVATGNVSLDVVLYGTDMTSGSNSIPVSQQHYALVSSTPYTNGTALLASPGAQADLNVCKTFSASNKATKNIYWGIAIPDPQAAGSYSGTNTFSAVKNEWSNPGDWCE